MSFHEWTEQNLCQHLRKSLNSLANFSFLHRIVTGCKKNVFCISTENENDSSYQEMRKQCQYLLYDKVLALCRVEHGTVSPFTSSWNMEVPLQEHVYYQQLDRIKKALCRECPDLLIRKTWYFSTRQWMIILYKLNIHTPKSKRHSPRVHITQRCWFVFVTTKLHNL